MFLSCLELASHPTVRGVQLWLGNPYRIHQRICLAFDGTGRMLFRLEDRPTHRLLVLSPGCPDWDRAFSDFSQVLAGTPRVKSFEPAIREGQMLRFRLRANPTVCREGHRHGLYREEDQLSWLARKGAQGGFTTLNVRAGGGLTQVSSKGPHKQAPPQRHYAVDYEGLLRVMDPSRFSETLRNGIGPAKSYGFGLLAIARA